MNQFPGRPRGLETSDGVIAAPVNGTRSFGLEIMHVPVSYSPSPLSNLHRTVENPFNARSLSWTGSYRAHAVGVGAVLVWRLVGPDRVVWVVTRVRRAGVAAQMEHLHVVVGGAGQYGIRCPRWVQIVRRVLVRASQRIGGRRHRRYRG